VCVIANAKQSRGRLAEDLVRHLARFLLTIEPGARLPTVRELARVHGVGISSVHVALHALEDLGAVRIETRGNLGAFMVGRSLGPLWQQAEQKPLVVALPLASSRRYEGLATALRDQLVGAGLSAFLVFIRGSRRRLAALEAGECHIAVMSAYAASVLVRSSESIVKELGPNTYNTGHRVFFAPSRQGSDPLHVVLDAESADQQLLSLMEFGHSNVELVSATHVEVPSLLADGRGDAAVWTLDEMSASWPEGIRNRSLSPEVLAMLGDRDTRAALVAGAADAGMLAPIASAIDPGEVERIQQGVIAGSIVARY
jgi:hypothetical protein